MELKFQYKIAAEEQRAGSNRTFMELKYSICSNKRSLMQRSNRTFMELKFDKPINLLADLMF